MKPPKRTKLCTGRHGTTGEPCQALALPGANVCWNHGGRELAVLKDAQTNLSKAAPPDDVLSTLAEIAFLDPRKLFDSEGNVLPIRDWPIEAARAVAGVEVLRRTGGTGEPNTEMLRIRFVDKVKALEMLAKYHGLLKEKLEHSGKLEIVWGGDDSAPITAIDIVPLKVLTE